VHKVLVHQTGVGAVGRQYQRLSRLDFAGQYLRLNYPVCANGSQQLIAFFRPSRLERREQALFELALYDRMVARQLLHRSTPDDERTAVAYMANYKPFAPEERDGEGSPHALRLGVPLRLGVDPAVSGGDGHLEKPFQRPRRQGGSVETALDGFEHSLRSHATRNLAGSVAAHPVSDDGCDDFFCPFAS
jgi:hypothetical protein